MTRKQCEHCPWKKSTNAATDIPNGYSREKHCALKKTIATSAEESFRMTAAMACHESSPEQQKACVGWVHHQLGPGNNIGLRLLVLTKDKRFTGLEIVGEQHKRFEDTIPKKRK